MKYFKGGALSFGMPILLFSLWLGLANPALGQHEVAGVVTDSSNGEPLPGVNVVVKGTSVGTATNQAGEYALEAPSPSDSLVFSFVGYETQTIAIDGRTEIDVAMDVDVITEEEILVMGYGERQTAETSTGAASSVSGESIAEIPAPNVSQSLGGKLPGVFMVNSSGQPGADEATLRVRGNSTLGNNDPLVVIDGVPDRSGGLSRLNPDDIENITVVKDATAAIYGARSGNGVILVETRRGGEGAPQFNISVNQGFAQPSRIPEMADAATYMRMINELNMYRGNEPRFSEEEVQRHENIEDQDPWLYHNTDWAEEALGVAARTRANMSLTGGREDLTYRLSLGGKTEGGVLKNSSLRYNQFNFRSNIDADITDNISLQFDTALRWEDRNGPTKDPGGVGFRMIYYTMPNMPAYWPNGRPGPAIEEGENPVIIGSDATGAQEEDRYYIQTDFQLSIEIPEVEGLSLRSTGVFDKTFQTLKTWETSWELYTFDEEAYRQQGGDPEQYLEAGTRGPTSPNLSQRSEDDRDILVNLVGDYDRTFENHSLRVLLGTEYQNVLSSNFSASRTEFMSEQIDQLFAGGVQNQEIFGTASHEAYLSYFTRVNYIFKERYILGFTGRYDGSFRFPEGNRFGFFPALSAGWRLGEESFFRNNVSFVDEFMLQASWGQTGNDRVAPYQYLRMYRFGRGYVFGGEEVASIQPAEVPNPNITWEVANQFDVGLETEFLEQRLALSVNYFNYLRENILAFRNASVPRSSGLELPRENIGEVRSWGFDGSVVWRQQVSNDLWYDVTINGGYSTNEIEFWDEPPGAPEWQRSTGSKMNTALRYEVIGVFSDEEEVENYPSWPGARPGDLIFRDVDGDGEITSDDRVRADRSSMPEWTGGLTLNASYKQFDISAFLQGSLGAAEYVQTPGGNYSNYYARFAEDRWTPENRDASYPRAFTRGEEYWVNQGNTFFWHSTDYLRLKQLQVAYELSESTLNSMGISVDRLRFYANGFNLATWTSFLADPEVANESSSYPQLQTFNMGVEMTF